MHSCLAAGVIGQIIPWNFPVLMMAWKIAPALAMGNTIVMKVAEQTPLSALRVGELALDAGLPAGCLNLVLGDGPVAGAALSKSKRIQKVSWCTGVWLNQTPRQHPLLLCIPFCHFLQSHWC